MVGSAAAPPTERLRDRRVPVIYALSLSSAQVLEEWQCTLSRFVGAVCSGPEQLFRDACRSQNRILVLAAELREGFCARWSPRWHVPAQPHLAASDVNALFWWRGTWHLMSQWEMEVLLVVRLL